MKQDARYFRYVDYNLHPWRFYKPHKRQKQFHASTDKVRIFRAGNRAGKTTCGSYEFIAFMMRETLNSEWQSEKKILKGRVASKRETVKQVLLPTLHSLLPDYRYRTEKSGREYDSIWTLFDDRGTDGKIIAQWDVLTYDQDPEAYASVELDICWFDEPPPKAVWNETWWRFTGERRNIIVTMTPLQSAAYFPEEIENNPNVPATVVTASLFDNTYLKDEQRDEMISGIVDEDEYNARVYGMYQSLMGSVFKAFNSDRHVVTEEEARRIIGDLECPVTCTIDPHDRKPPAVVWTATLPGGQVLVLDCMPEENWAYIKDFRGGAESIVKMIKEREKLYDYKVTKRRMDPKFGAHRRLNIHATVQELYMRAGMIFNLAPTKDLTTRHTVIKDYLETSALTNIPKLLISERAANVIRMFRLYTYKDRNDPEAPLYERVNEVWKDYADCIGYELVRLRKEKVAETHEKPKVSDYSFEKDAAAAAVPMHSRLPGF